MENAAEPKQATHSSPSAHDADKPRPSARSFTELLRWVVGKAATALAGVVLGGIAGYVWNEEVVKKARLEELVGDFFGFKKPMDVQRLIDYSDWKCVNGVLVEDKLTIIDLKWSPHEENAQATQTKKGWSNATESAATYERHDLLSGDDAFGKQIDPAPTGQRDRVKGAYFEYAADQIQNGHIWTANIVRKATGLDEPIGELFAVPPGYFVRNMTVRYIFPQSFHLPEGQRPKWRAIEDQNSDPNVARSSKDRDDVPLCDSSYSCNLSSRKDAQRIFVRFDAVQKKTMCAQIETTAPSWNPPPTTAVTEAIAPVADRSHKRRRNQGKP